MTFNILGVKITLKKEIAVFLIVVILLFAAAAGYLLTRNKDGIVFSTDGFAEATVSEPAVTETTTISPPEEKVEKIKVYIVGCVNNPGIVTIDKGQLIADAVAAAGGLTNEADPSAINMVFPLDENVMLHIKPKIRQGTDMQSEKGNGFEVVSDGRGVVEASKSLGSSGKGKININTATVDELDTLPGIGEATAKDIISYRKKIGKFKTISDIMQVPRIKEGRFENIKDFITVE